MLPVIRNQSQKSTDELLIAQAKCNLMQELSEQFAKPLWGLCVQGCSRMDIPTDAVQCSTDVCIKGPGPLMAQSHHYGTFFYSIVARNQAKKL